MKDTMLTTIDNPFNPLDDFVNWYRFDVQKGYNTCSLLAKKVYTSEGNSEADENVAIDVAMKEIVAYFDQLEKEANDLKIENQFPKYKIVEEQN